MSQIGTEASFFNYDAEGVPVVWTLVVEEGTLNSCNNEVVLPAFDQLVTAFHPELTEDLTVHRYFLNTMEHQ